MRRLGSVVMRAADASRVPAGAALAVDRHRFAGEVTRLVSSHPLITVVREEVLSVPRSLDGPVVVATGPLTSPALSADIAALVGAEHLYFYDAISPIVLAESIDSSKVFRASRWGRSLRGRSSARSEDAALQRGSDATPAPLSDSHYAGHGAAPSDAAPPDPDQCGRAAGTSGPAPSEPGQSGWSAGASAPACGVDDGEGDYLNCPFTAEEYARFHEALTTAEKAALHEFDDARFFEGCLPIEVMAGRGVDTLRFGPMKPVGLTDPRTGREAYAVVQLRQDTLAGDHFSLVGFQTQMKWGEQARVFKLVPGLENAEFVRFGMIHRNTYINGPTVLRDTWQTKHREDLFFAGQISGVEGYVESAASGLVAGQNAARLALGLPTIALPRTTALGALAYYVSHAEARHYQPSNITFGIMPPIDDSRLRRQRTDDGRRPSRKEARKLAHSALALADLETWMRECGGR
jgi:methylenetetrahydrofolate--tRNA-(uracil-5-)-methyltransferase